MSIGLAAPTTSKARANALRNDLTNGRGRTAESSIAFDLPCNRLDLLKLLVPATKVDAKTRIRLFLGLCGKECVLGGTGVGGIVYAAAPGGPGVRPGGRPTMLVIFVGRSCETPAACALVSSGESRKEMSSLVGMIVSPSTPGTPRRSSRKCAFFGRGHSLIFWSGFP